MGLLPGVFEIYIIQILQQESGLGAEVNLENEQHTRISNQRNKVCDSTIYDCAL